jgi:energy-coupling factor transporter ATP-binding protein EcfA2
MQTNPDFADALVVTGLTKRYAAGAGRCLVSVGALDDVAIRVALGEAVAIVGPPCSGKSTLLRCAAGLLRPDEGAVRWRAPNVTPRPGRRPLLRPRYLDLAVVRHERDVPVPGASLPILLVDSCDRRPPSGPDAAWRLVAAACGVGDSIVLAGRTLESCLAAIPDRMIASVVHLERGRVVGRAEHARGRPSRVAEVPIAVASRARDCARTSEKR